MELCTCSAEIFDECLTASLWKFHFDLSITDDQREVIFQLYTRKRGKSLSFAVFPYLFFCRQFFYWWHLSLQQVEQVAKEAP